MIGIDTNVLVRYLVQDEPAQASLANAFFEHLTADGLELPDALVAASGERNGCSHTVTFDAKAARSGLMQLLS
jgi:predicted nucleic-acid-binding protein